jgi:hypothetical protein
MVGYTPTGPRFWPCFCATFGVEIAGGSVISWVVASECDGGLNRPRFYAHFLCWEGWRDAEQVRREHQGQGGAAGP